jgi:hypothetical protein
VFGFIVNESIGGPPLELDIFDEWEKGVAIDPAYAMWLRLWLSYLQIATIDLYRGE